MNTSGNPKARSTGCAPTATVLIPCHNGMPFIREAVQSWLGQTRKPERLVVVDDASTDGSSQVLDELAREAGIEVIRNREKLGKAESLNRAFDRVETRYVALMDADDLAVPGRLERQLAFMEANATLGCSSSFVYYISPAGKRIGRGVLDLLDDGALQKYLAGTDPFGLFCPAAILRTEVVKDPKLRFRGQFWPADDIDLWNRIAEAGWKVLAQPEYLTEYRVHGASIITSKAKYARVQYEWVRECLRARRKGLPEPTREQFDAHLAAMPALRRLDRFRKFEAKAACRAAGLAYGSGRLLQAAAYSLKAFCLQPLYVGRRVTRHFGKV